MIDNPSISVVIRCRNGADTLGLVFEALEKQQRSHELIFVDNGSTDGSREMAERRRARIVDVTGYTPGRALNKGFAAASGDLVVTLSAHCVPVTPHFLDLAMAPLIADESIAAVRCLDLRRTTDMADWTRLPRLDPGADFNAVRRWGLGFQGSAVRRAVWLERPIDETYESAEDKAWTLTLLDAGWSVGYAAAPFVYLRPQTPQHRFNRTLHHHNFALRATGQLPPLTRFPPLRTAISDAKDAFLLALAEWRSLAAATRRVKAGDSAAPDRRS